MTARVEKVQVVEEDEEDVPTVPHPQEVELASGEHESTLEFDPYQHWLENTRAARTASRSIERACWLYRTPISDVRDGVECSIDGSSWMGEISTEMRENASGEKYAVRVWSSLRVNDGRSVDLFYYSHVFLSRQMATKELRVSIR